MSRLSSFFLDRFSGVLPAVLALVGLVAAVTPLDRAFFEGAPYSQALLVTAAAIVVASLTNQAWNPAVNLLVGLIAGTVVLLVVLADPPRVVGVPGEPGPVQLWIDLANGWTNTLAAPVPIEMSAELLTLPLGLCWAGGYLTVLLIRATRSAMVSTLPTLVVMVLLLLLGPGPLSVLSGVTIAVSVLAQVAARAAAVGHGAGGAVAVGPGTTVPLWRFAVRSFALVGIPAVLAAALMGVPLALFAIGDPGRTDLHNPAGPAVRDELTPLSSLPGQLLQEEPSELFTVRFVGAGSLAPTDLDRLRIATLEQYDGALWTSEGVFLPVVRRVREPDTTTRPTFPVSAEIRLTSAYDSSYLPVTGLLREVGGRSLGLNEDSDTLVSGEERGMPATVSFIADVPTGSRPLELSEEAPPGTGDFVGLGGVDVPEEFERFVAEVAGEVTEPVARLVALETAMVDQARFGYSVRRSYSGHSLPVLANYVGPQPQEGFAVARQGYAEQSAAAFTILARLQGVPARVAVGYLISDPQAALDGELVSVTTADAHAWTEVYLGGEWVTFDPTDRTERNAQEIPVPELDETVRAPATIDDPLPAPRLRPPTTEPAAGLPLRWLALGALVLLTPILPLVAKFVRRRLRRRGSSSNRLFGAWRELRDQLRDRGVKATRSSTARDLGLDLASHAPPEALAELEQFVQLLDHGLFAADEPGAEAAALAWKSVGRLARGLTSGQPRWRRLLGPFDPRSLRPPPAGQPQTRPEADDDESRADGAIASMVDPALNAGLEGGARTQQPVATGVGHSTGGAS